MKVIEKQQFDMERALYGEKDLLVRQCAFDGPADGESAFKEAADIEAEDCYFNLRYPFWHNRNLKIRDSRLTELCRAALWYSENIEIRNTELYGIKALRECSRVFLKDCDIVSPEFAWSVDGISVEGCKAQSEYFFLRSKNIRFSYVAMKGKYSFQYIENAEFDHCDFDTKDAFWHGKNVVVRDSTVKGEYLGWYGDGLTFINCHIIGTQPLCYCKNLKLINCKMTDTDLAFEKSQVEAELTAFVASIKNPAMGTIKAPGVGELIMDDKNAKGKVIIG